MRRARPPPGVWVSLSGPAVILLAFWGYVAVVSVARIWL